MPYGLFVTNICLNECIICCAESIPGLRFSHVGKTSTEKKGLTNLFLSMDGDGIAASGGDPLRNLPALELIVDNYSGHKFININPISFLTIELNKCGKNITAEDLKNLELRAKSEGLSKKISNIVRILQQFNEIELSTGNVQSPNPELMQFANFYFENFILEYLPIKINKSKINGTFIDHTTTNFSGNVSCVGKIRVLAEQNEFSSEIINTAEGIQSKINCQSSSKNIFFQYMNGENALHYFICCSPGLNPYVTFKSEMSLEKMADMSPIEIKSIMNTEFSNIKSTAIYNLLNYNPCCDIFFGGNMFSTPHSYFKKYIKLAEEFFEEKTGQKISIVERTLTFNRHKKAKACECCYTVSILFHDAGISVKEWHDHLESKFAMDFYRNIFDEKKQKVTK